MPWEFNCEPFLEAGQSFKKIPTFMPFSAVDYGQGGNHSLGMSRFPFSYVHPSTDPTPHTHCLLSSYGNTSCFEQCLLPGLRDTPSSDYPVLELQAESDETL